MPLGRLEVFEAAEDNWEEYVERLVQFFVANEIDDDVKKRAILLSNVGARTYGILRSLLSPVRPDEVSYDRIVKVLREHFHPRPSVTVARFRFFSCSRSINEPVPDYIARLKQLSRDCQFGSFLEEMIRDRLVCGINSDLIQSRLLSEPELSLQKATEMAVALETASRNQQELAGGLRVGQSPTEPAVQRIHASESRSSHGRGSHEHASKAKFSDSGANKCWRCLSSKHSESECFFKRKRCFRCSKYGHTSAAHRAGTVNSLGDVPQQGDEATVDVGEREPEDAVVGDLFTCSAGLSRGRPPILLDVTLNGKQVQMELDTGASVSVCSYGRFKELWPSGDRLLRPTDILLRTFSGEKLVVRGEVVLEVGYQGSTYQLPLVILEGRGPLLFGRNWLHQIRLNWQSICTVSSETGVEAVVDKFPEIFQDDLGCARDVEVSIPVDESASPIFYKPRTVPLAYKAQVDAELERQLKAGLLVPVKWNSWAAPIVTVPKASGELRICGDYRLTVNRVTPVEQYPLPKAEELFTKFQGATVFSQLDLKSAYNQLPLCERSRQYLAINTHKGILVPTRLGYGYASAPAVFQRYMDTLLSGISGVGVFLDDVVVSGKNSQEHNTALEEVLRRLSDANLRLQRRKCRFGVKSVIYLGHRIGSEGVQPTAEKVSAVENAPVPKNVKELQAWLGLINYYSKFLKDLATILAPLYKLLKKEEKWDWGREQQQAFQTGKDLLKSPITLAHFDESAPVILACDASPWGLGCVLSIVDRHLGERPVAFYSRSLSQTEQRYSQTDREGLAVIAGVRRFHYYLAGRQFSIRTDHKPLLGMLGEDKPISTMASPRVTRWALLLSGYKYKLEYVPGTKQGHCDGLSRLPLPSDSSELPTPAETVHLMEFVDSSPVTASCIRTFTARDPVLSVVLQYTRDGWPTTGLLNPELVQFRRREGELSTHEGCLLWGSRVVVPVKLQRRVLHMLHEGHLGESHTKSFARMYVWWPNIDVDICRMVSECTTCQTYRRQAPVAPLSPWTWPTRPWERIHVDYCGPVNGQMMLVIADACTKWLDVHVTTRSTAEVTIEELRKSFSNWGLPKVVVTDNATCFTSPAFQSFCAKNGIKHLLTAPLSPKSNGLAERAVQTVKQGVRKQQGGSLQSKVVRFLFAYRTTPHSVTRHTPAELMMGRQLRTRLDCVLPNLQERMVEMQGRMKERYDEKACRRIVLPGMPVLVSQVAGLAGVDRSTRWLRGSCIGRSGFKLTVRLTDGRVIQRHLDQVVPDGASMAQRDGSADADGLEADEAATADQPAAAVPLVTPSATPTARVAAGGAVLEPDPTRTGSGAPTVTAPAEAAADPAAGVSGATGASSGTSESPAQPRYNLRPRKQHVVQTVCFDSGGRDVIDGRIRRGDRGASAGRGGCAVEAPP